MNKLIAKIPAVTTFDVPAGNYRGKLIRTKPMLKQTGKGSQAWVRFVYEVNVPGMCSLYPCAGRNFVVDLNPGSDLRNFLECWLGRAFFMSRSGQELNFETLIGIEADLYLEHYEGANYDKPLVIIESIHPVNTIKTTQPNSTN